MKESAENEAVEFFLKEEVLKLGDFTLKSGRKSPYFFNTGSLCSASQLAHLGKLYAKKFMNTPEFHHADVIFGSAYKGIPISVATAIALSGTEYESVRAVSDRKEAKTHGDAGNFLGVLKPGDKVVIVDDVITNGATKLEALEKLRASGCEPIGFIIAFDRAERLDNSTSGTAREVVERETKLPVYSLATVHDIAHSQPAFAETIRTYLESLSVAA